MEKLKWTQRQFHFGFEPAYLPFMLERLWATPARAAEIAAAVADAKLGEQANGQWSAKQHIGHLTDLEALHEARVQQFREGLTELKAADMSNQKTHEANHNSRVIADLLSEFRKAREQFIKKIENLPPAILKHKALHPRLKQMISVTDLAYFVAEHDTHHLMVMAQLLRT